MKPIGALVGNADLDEGDAHGNDGNAKHAVANRSKHLKLATEAALLRGEETFCRHQIPETNLGDTLSDFSSQTKGVDRGEGYEAKVGGGDEVPALPGVEHERAQHDVHHDDHDAEGDRNDHLRGIAKGQLQNRFVWKFAIRYGKGGGIPYSTDFFLEIYNTLGDSVCVENYLI